MIEKFGSKLLIISAIALVLSCGDIPTCVDTETSLVKLSFVDVDGEAKSITLTSLKAIDNEDGFPEYADSIFSSINLPLNPGSYTSTFILEQAGVIDTLGLTYDVVAKLISPECGLDASFSKLDTTFTTYDKLNILQTAIHEDVTVNIEITL
jgi:hypothetical protein